jgi:hypothetical protein
MQRRNKEQVGNEIILPWSELSDLEGSTTSYYENACEHDVGSTLLKSC